MIFCSLKTHDKPVTIAMLPLRRYSRRSVNIYIQLANPNSANEVIFSDIIYKQMVIGEEWGYIAGQVCQQHSVGTPGLDYLLLELGTPSIRCQLLPQQTNN